jgi:CRISPR/Cas system CSM-associated protein Csm3 (group 7 of RAMP superfamily)
MATSTTRGQLFTLARITIELRDPLTIGRGGADPTDDRPCVLDANELPTIPGSSIAGALRASLPGGSEGDKANDLFGYQDKRRGAASRVEVSWAQVHDALNRPIPLLSTERPQDAVVLELSTRRSRDHVRISGFGTADGAGKFDTGYVPVGTRFTFELVLHGGTEAEVGIAELLAILAAPEFRLGGLKQRGYGAIKLRRVEQRTFDLANPRDLKDFASLPRDLSRPVPAGLLQAATPTWPAQPTSSGEFLALEVDLVAEGTWLVANGAPRPDVDGAQNEPKINPYRELRIVWKQNATTKSELGAVVDHYVLPGSSIKGALWHRTAFHLAKAEGRVWRQPGDEAGRADDNQTRLGPLFGTIKSGDDGAPGRVRIDECAVEASKAKLQVFDHVALDQFTGGPLDGHLFREEVVLGTPDTPLTLSVTVDLRARGKRPGAALDPAMRAAFAAALRDLIGGRLPLGAADARGHGFFKLRDGERHREIFNEFIRHLEGAP